MHSLGEGAAIIQAEYRVGDWVSGANCHVTDPPFDVGREVGDDEGVYMSLIP